MLAIKILNVTGWKRIKEVSGGTRVSTQGLGLRSTPILNPTCLFPVNPPPRNAPSLCHCWHLLGPSSTVPQQVCLHEAPMSSVAQCPGSPGSNEATVIQGCSWSRPVWPENAANIFSHGEETLHKMFWTGSTTGSVQWRPLLTARAHALLSQAYTCTSISPPSTTASARKCRTRPNAQLDAIRVV